MTIQVRSNEIPQPEVKPEAVAAENSKDANLSALADKAAEQNTSEDSEASEAEKEVSESDESDEEASPKDEGGDKSKDQAEDKPKKKSGFHRKIDKLNARIASERQRADALEARLAQLESGAGGKKAETVDSKAKTEDSGKPKPEDYDSHQDWVEAVADWKAEEKLKAREQQAEQARLKSDQDKLLSAHAERVKAFAEKTEDWGDVLEGVDDVPVSLAVQQLLISSENGPALMYELAKNRSEFERINSLPPLAAARELGKIEAKLAATTSLKAEPKKITQAPKPLEPVGANSKGATRKSIYDPDLSQADYERLRREYMKRRGAS